MLGIHVASTDPAKRASHSEPQTGSRMPIYKTAEDLQSMSSEAKGAKERRTGRFWLPPVFVLLAIAFSAGCDCKTLKGESNCKTDDNSDEKPKIVGCDSVEYQGCRFSPIGCSTGLSSAGSVHLTMGSGSCDMTFHNVVCTNGCVSSISGTQ